MSRFKLRTPEALDALLMKRRMSTSLHDLLVMRALLELQIESNEGKIHWTEASLENAYKRVNDEKKVKG
jgi:hypothetical protein